MTFLKYLASAKGRRFTFYASVTASIGAFSINYFPHTFFVSKHRQFVAAYKEGEERPVSDVLKKRYELALEMLKVIDFERKYIKPFMVAGFDLYHIGATKFRNGSLIGIPTNFSYTVAADIDKMNVIIRGKPVDWDSRGGKLLEESLVLSEDEQIFGIAREILQVRNNSIYLNSFFAGGTVLAYYAATSAINSKLRLFYRPVSLRLMLYSIVGLFSFGVYSFLTDFTQVKLDGDTDEKLATLGRGFIDAGVRFYDKLLKKNIACRELTGDESEYTALGNESFLLRQKRLPLTMRKSFFEEKLKEVDEKEKSSTEETAKK